jgi:CRP-like cAMP-binding protein
MKNIHDALRECPLFSGIAETDLSVMLTCLSAVRDKFERGKFIFSTGDRARSVGVVLKGGVHVLQEDYWGDRNILSHIGPGGLFGDAFACAGIEKLPVSAVAASETEILLIDLSRIVTTCSSACEFHTGLIKNMLRMLARKNLSLIEKIEHITRRTTRKKLLSYLSAQAKEAGSSSFDLPFNRQGMADYLAVDRSAMSAELSKMRSEGLLTYEHNHFRLMQPT